MRTSSVPERHRCHGINPGNKSRKSVERNRDVIKVKRMGDRVSTFRSEVRVNRNSEHRSSLSYPENGK